MAPTTGEARPPASAVLYTADRGGDADLFLRSPSGRTRLTRSPGADNWARWSPDGRRIAFQSRRDGDSEVYVMNADGSALLNLSRHAGHDGLPAWSPDGQSIAFFSSRGLGYAEGGPIPGRIYTVSALGGDPTLVTVEPLTSTFGPTSWSPDGKSLLLARDDGGTANLVTLDLATGNERRLTSGRGDSGGGVYSPDGRLIAYYEQTSEQARVVTIRPDGSGRRVLFDAPGWHYPYAWSPDGQWLSVTSLDATGRWSILALSFDGARVETLVERGRRLREASWQPRP